MRILHVEGTLIAQKLVERVIKEVLPAYDLVGALSLTEARKKLRESTFDLILLDYLLGDGSGLELIEEAKETPIIMITGDGSENIAVEAMKIGAYDYLVKDSRDNFLRMLPKTIERILGKRKTEKTLEDSRLMYRMLMEEAGDAIFILNTNTGKFINANKQAEILIGRKKEKIVKMQLEDLFSGESAEQCIRLKEGSSSHTNEIIEDIYLLHDRGKEIPVTVTVSQAKLSDKTILQYVFRDITQRKQMEIQLGHAQKMESIGQLAAGIAHEMNTPLQFISNNTSFLRESFGYLIDVLNDYNQLAGQLKNETSSMEMVKKINAKIIEKDLDFLIDEIPEAIDQSLEGIGRVNKIVQAMKEFSHPGMDEEKPNDLNKAIETTLNISQSEWKYVANIETSLDPELPLVPCCINDFNQSVLNIIVNASQAIKDSLESERNQKGTINIVTRQKGKWAETIIKDSGTGIPEEIRAKVFDPFFTTKEVGQGTGQGLALAYNMIVKKHNGEISMDTELGEGTTFMIRLPLQKNL